MPLFLITHSEENGKDTKQEEQVHNVDQPSTSKQPDFLHERKNIFDNDEFDVFAKGSNVDKTKIYYGKRNKGQMGHWKADAEEDVEKLRLLYSRYGLGAEDTDNETMMLRGELN